MTKNQPNNAIVVSVVTQRLRALRAYVDPNARISIEGKHLDARGVIAIYQRCLDSRAALATRRAELFVQIEQREAAEAARLEADRALQAWVRGEFGSHGKEALEFGFPPARVHVRTVEEKALAAARGKATREARGTLGKREREKIRGTIGGTAAGSGSEPIVPR